MTRRLIATLAGLLACLALLAGCGSSSKTTSSSSAPATTTSSSTPSSSSSSGETGTTSTTPPTTVPGTAPTDVKAATEECKSIIHGETKLSSGAKAKLEGACAEAAKGNTSVVKKVAREVCEETVDASSLPQATKEQAKESCEKT